MNVRKLLKVIGVLCGLLLMAEVGSGYLNFQRGSERGLGLAWLADRVVTKSRPSDLRGISLHDVYQPEFSALRQALEKSYSAEFEALMQTARERACDVVMLYIPTAPTFPAARELYAGLAERAGVTFVDMEPVKARYSAEQLYLSPGDTHPSRLLGQLTADAVAKHIERESVQGCAEHEEQQEFIGPWVRNLSEIRETAKGLAFRFTSNEFGFRSAGRVEGAATRSILIVGDSFTFGTSLPDQDSWPAFLQRRLPQIRVLNAGVGGISIVREHDILRTATASARADLLILQVNETDLQGLTPAYWTDMPQPPMFSDEIAGFFP